MPDLTSFAGILRFNSIWGVVREEECVLQVRSTWTTHRGSAKTLSGDRLDI
jgi:hypothetical protein